MAALTRTRATTATQAEASDRFRRPGHRTRPPTLASTFVARFPIAQTQHLDPLRSTSRTVPEPTAPLWQPRPPLHHSDVMVLGTGGRDHRTDARLRRNQTRSFDLCADTLRPLADYAINRDFPDLAELPASGNDSRQLATLTWKPGRRNSAIESQSMTSA